MDISSIYEPEKMILQSDFTMQERNCCVDFSRILSLQCVPFLMFEASERFDAILVEFVVIGFEMAEVLYG